MLMLIWLLLLAFDVGFWLLRFTPPASSGGSQICPSRQARADLVGGF